MGYYSKDDSPIFSEKAVENLKAAVLCVENNFINASATRFYYSLIHLALKNAIEKDVPENLFLRENNHIDKAGVYNNAKLMVKKGENYSILKISLQALKILREKADYLGEHVALSEIKRYRMEIESLFFKEGIQV